MVETVWISGRNQRQIKEESGSDLGTVTLPDDPAGVYLDGERRELPVFGPGGYVWRPSRNQQVLVIKAGAQGEAPCVVGVPCGAKWNLKEGEVLIYSPAATIHLQENGIVNVTGVLTVNNKRVLTAE